MATIDFSSFRPLPTDYTFQGTEKVLVQPLGAREPLYITWERFTQIFGTGGSSGSEYELKSLSSDYTIPDLSAEQKLKNGFEKVYKISANTFNVFLPTGAINDQDFIPDPTKINIVSLIALFGTTYVRGFVQDIPDTDPPVFVSALTNSSGTLITINVTKTVGSQNVTFMKNGVSISTTPILSGSSIQYSVSPPILITDVVVANGTILDTIGNVLTLEPNQMVSNEVSLVQKSINRSGSTSGIISSVYPSNLVFGNGSTDLPFSFAGWFNFDSTSAQILFSIQGTGAGCTLDIGSSGKLELILWRADQGAGLLNLYDLPSLNQWHFITITYDASKTNTGLILKIDNIVQTATQNNFGSYTGMGPGNTDWRLNLFGVVSYQPFTGIADNLAFFNKVLSTGEQTAMYGTSGVGNRIIEYSSVVSNSNIKAYYRFNDDLLDSSTSIYNLTGTATFSTSQPS